MPGFEEMIERLVLLDWSLEVTNRCFKFSLPNAFALELLVALQKQREKVSRGRYFGWIVLERQCDLGITIYEIELV